MSEILTEAAGIKMFCDVCWLHVEPQDRLDVVVDPKPGSRMTWRICPKCRAAEDWVMACDEPGCWEEITCGTPTPDGYRSTCSKHRPND